MFAIVTIAGQQFKVKKDDQLFVHRLAGNVGDNVEFSDVLMTSDEGKINLGSSLKVKAEIVDHLKGDKVIVKDIFNYVSPFGILGKIADFIFLKKYMQCFLIERNKVIKDYAESGKWRDVLEKELL